MAIYLGEIDEKRAPNAEQRAWMAKRSEAIDAALVPADPDVIRSELASLFAVLSMQNMGAEEAGAMVAIYQRDLADLPEVGLREACRYFRQSAKWVPSIAEIRTEAFNICAPWAKEALRIKEVLAAKVTKSPGADQRRQVTAYWREQIRGCVVAAGMEEQAKLRGAFNKPVKEPTQKERQDWLNEQEAKAATEPPPKLSSAVLSKLSPNTEAA